MVGWNGGEGSEGIGEGGRGSSRGPSAGERVPPRPVFPRRVHCFRSGIASLGSFMPSVSVLGGATGSLSYHRPHRMSLNMRLFCLVRMDDPGKGLPLNWGQPTLRLSVNM